jgi:chromosome segregation ATPase
MNESNDKLKLFTTRMRQLILQYKDVKKENEELYAMVDSREKEIEQLKKKLQQSQDDYNSLRMAKMIEVTDGDIEASKKRIASLIREVNKCITLMSEQ